jgi:hypothetical protein
LALRAAEAAAADNTEGSVSDRGAPSGATIHNRQCAGNQDAVTSGMAALARLLRATENPPPQKTLTQHHANDNETRDAHHQVKTPEYLVPVDPVGDLQCGNRQ